MSTWVQLPSGKSIFLPTECERFDDCSQIHLHWSFTQILQLASQLEFIPRECLRVSKAVRDGVRVNGVVDCVRCFAVELVRVELVGGLKGGKGGFGSLLRGGNTKAKKNDNSASLRNLDGRRIGDVENERALEEWVRNSANSEESKILSESELNERFARINRGQSPEKKVCKFGANCKYKFKCTAEHPVEDNETDEAVEKEKIKQSVGRVMNEAEDAGQKVHNAVLAGLSRKRKKSNVEHETQITKKLNGKSEITFESQIITNKIQ